MWRIGFWGGKSYGWHYKVMLAIMNLVLATTNDRSLVLSKYF